MTDLLTAQASIKARTKPVRDKSGQFMRPSAALEIKVAAERMKVRLERDVEALEHAEGYAWVHGHRRPLPGGKACVRPSLPSRPSLFDPQLMEMNDAA